MYGQGIAKGMWVTIKHLVDTYLDDLKWWGRRYTDPAVFPERQGPHTRGVFTVQYPEEKLPMPERFRFTPFLVVNDPDAPEHPSHIWCTSCGICAKVCPPQCIWIMRGVHSDTGRPIPEPAEFYIDIDVCMNCGYCAEFCPFDAIKMDHNYELASYDRTAHHIHDLARLSKPVSYWEHIAPTLAANERAAREAEAARKAARKKSAPAKQQDDAK
ncbi:MAG: 4Fe-4S binding protein [Anaerolineae bacterium]|nr:4Fe-4S binding protein [Anaerolineae bacterium]